MRRAVPFKGRAFDWPCRWNGRAAGMAGGLLADLGPRR
jgi:hypothetical protein